MILSNHDLNILNDFFLTRPIGQNEWHIMF